MLPKIHIIIGAIVSSLIYFTLNINFIQFLFIFLASFLIDFDHYLLYLYRKKDLNPINAYNWFVGKRKKWLKLSATERENYQRPYLFFHSLEFLTITILISVFYPIFVFVLYGILIHFLLDYIEIIYIHEKFYQKVSIIWTYFKNNNKREFFN